MFRILSSPAGPQGLVFSGNALPSLRLQRAHSSLLSCSHLCPLSTCTWGPLPRTANKERVELEQEYVSVFSPADLNVIQIIVLSEFRLEFKSPLV